MRSVFLQIQFILSLLLCPVMNFAFAQESSKDAIANQYAVSARVVDNSGQPVAGATVLNKSDGKWTVTDADGNFSIVPDMTNVIIVSIVGFKTATLDCNSISGKNIVLEEDVLRLEESVVTGYTTQKKADLTGAVSVINVEQVMHGTSGNAMRATQGHVAGMAITTTGSPIPSATVRIRGEGTLNDNNPLYIIDGMPTTRSMGELASLDIESIQVLKDASSASIYGSRAANGVIIITTKKGKDKVKIDFGANLTLVSRRKPYQLMNTYQRGVAQYWAIKNDNPDADPNSVGIGKLYIYTDHKDANGNWVLDNVAWKEWLDDGHTMRASDTDWQKEILRTGVIQQYNLSLSSGKENSHSLFSLEYYNNKGTIDGSFYKRYNFRVNSDYSFLNSHVTIGENFSASYWKQNKSINSGRLDYCKQLMSIVPVHAEDGGWGGPIGGMSDRQNPVRMIDDYKQNNSNNIRLLGNAYADVKFIEGLHFRTNIGIDGVGFWYRDMYHTYSSGFLSETQNKVTQTSSFTSSLTNSNTLQYVNDFGNHNIDIMLGEELIKNKYQQHWGSRTDYVLETEDYMWLSSGEKNKENGSTATDNVLLSYFTKLNYSYAHKYLASFTLRRDGSSVFGSNNRWATFPAFSLGWVISSENFFSGIADYVTLLKLRYGWGKNGNSSIDPYSSFQLYETLYDYNNLWDVNWGTAYDITGNGGSLPSGYRRTQRANKNLKWESTKQHNLGLDFAILDSKISGSIDYYLKYTRDILMKPGTVATLGEGAGTWLNGADIDNKGFEVTLNYKDHFGNFGLNISGVFSHNKQKVKHVPDDVLNNFAGNGSTDVIIGRSRNSLYGYVAEGLFQNDEEVKEHAVQTGAAPGRIKYKDLNDDNVIDAKDRTWIGCSDPDLEYGISIGGSWKNFDVNMFFHGLLGRDLNVSGWKSWTDFYFLGTVGENYGTRMLDAWTPNHTNTSIPALSVNNNNDEGRMSTYFVENGSFMKLRNIELGYTLPKHISEKLRMQNARLALRAENVFTLKKTWGNDRFTGLDPETPGSTYPMPFSMSFSINLTF